MPKKDGVKSTSKGRGNAKLTDKQQRFVEEYLIDLNATQAAIRAGYAEKAANREGSRLLSNVDIQDAIQEAKNKRSERVQISQDDVLKGLLEVVAISMGKQKITETEIARADGGAIVSTDIVKTCFEPHAANKAFELLGKHLGMFSQKVELSGTVTSQNVELTKAEFADLAKELLAEV